MTRKRKRSDPRPEPALRPEPRDAGFQNPREPFAIVDGELQPPLPTIERLREPRRYAPPCSLCTSWRKLMGAGDNRTVITKADVTHRYLRCEICGNTWQMAVRHGRHPLDDLPGKTEESRDSG